MVSNKHPSRGGAFVGRCVYYREAFIEKKSQKRGHLFEGAFKRWGRLFKALRYWQNSQITTAVHYFQKQPPEAFCKEVVHKNFANFIGKHLFWSLFLIKLQAFRPATLLKKKLQHKCFPMKCEKFLRTPILKNTCERLLPYFHYNSHHSPSSISLSF